MAPMGTSTSMGSAAPTPAPQEADDFGLQVRPMGLKVHYTFDKDNQIHCLARWPHILQIQAIPIDDRNTIGVVDLRTCLMAVGQCSPEIINHPATDYAVYAYDYSEPDVPLVGQGMLSWGLDPANDQLSQQLLTGRVTRNLLAIFGNGIRETLEVKLKLNAVPKQQRTDDSNASNNLDNINRSMSMVSSAPTPIETANNEWNSFIQSNPTFGRSASVAAIPSPSLPPARLENQVSDHMSPNIHSDGPSHQISRSSGSALATSRPSQDAPPSSQQGIEIVHEKPRPSRPSSRASRKQPTGRPRGRPRKKPVETGNTSAAEEATDADEGPQRKRAKITQVDYSSVAPFGSAPESLRVAASTSGSLRNMRPVAPAGAPSANNHLHDGPRAPTPVPDASSLRKPQRRRAPIPIARRESLTEYENAPFQAQFNQQHVPMHLSQDARSPTDSIGQSPDQGYVPESPADLGSSPPVPRASAYMQSSPMPSSPILPPMPLGAADSGFMSGGIEDYFEEDELQQELPQQKDQPDLFPSLSMKQQAQQAANRKDGDSGQQQQQQQNQKQQQQPQVYSFQEVTPGPPEFLPATSIFNPVGKTRSLNRSASSAASAAPTPPETNQTATREPVSRSLKRSDTTTSMPGPSEHDAISHHLQPEKPASPPILQSLHGMANGRSHSLPAQGSKKTEDAVPMESEADGGSKDASHTAISIPEQGNDERVKIAIKAEEPNQSAENPIVSASTTKSAPGTAARQLLAPRPLSRADLSRNSNNPAIPASDPVPEPITLTLPQTCHSEAPCPPSDAVEPPKYNKNQVKKQSIKERLESAIQRGEMPSFCNNCGAIETPTWRKIWTQEHEGVPGFHEFSDKPGYVTTIDILARDDEGKPTAYRLVKKNLGPGDNKFDWKEFLLCNPCGIWLAKFKSHRPPDRWDKDAARLNQPRRKREPKGSNSRSRKGRAKSEGQMQPTSEAYFPTDPVGPGDRASPSGQEGSRPRQQSTAATDSNDDRGRSLQPSTTARRGFRSSPNRDGPGSTHSRGSGTADSPIALDDFGTTRRILFPSPRKDGNTKILGELAVNIVQTVSDYPAPKPETEPLSGKAEAAPPVRPSTPPPRDGDDLDHQLFGTPPPHPSTPPPKAPSGGPFKTPTRPTPNHRPITRSISRSIRSCRSSARSPSQAFPQLQRTPSKTPRSAGNRSSQSLSASKRRTPRSGHLHAHFSLGNDDHRNNNNQCDMHFESPFTATLQQLLSEADGFTSGSPSHGLVDLDLGDLPNLDNHDLQSHLDAAAAAAAADGTLDFGSFLGTDMAMPSSPPSLGRGGGMSDFGISLHELGTGSEL
ncbi:hypothetical protein VTK73DRAFT_1614 [Phialemonium thermophilum]|uniref:Ams2/SPT21 N-terminal domain-containing protein n=1 Tax=Phialemonium thermophilum TaxID=223376 RepID=A0ABR3X8S5_9PEZI